MATIVTSQESAELLVKLTEEQRSLSRELTQLQNKIANNEREIASTKRKLLETVGCNQTDRYFLVSGHVVSVRYAEESSLLPSRVEVHEISK